MNPRNEQGWLIPGEGTKSWIIYHLMMNGFKAREISDLLQEDDPGRIRVMCSHIKNPAVKNRNQLKWYNNNPKRAKEIREKSIANGKSVGSGSYSKYVRKLVKALGITFTEAVELERKELEKENARQNGI